jgi:hypothetical protein
MVDNDLIIIYYYYGGFQCPDTASPCLQWAINTHKSFLSHLQEPLLSLSLSLSLYVWKMHVGSPWQGGWHEWERKGGVNASFSMGGISLFQWLSMYRRRGDCWIFWHIRWPCPQFSFMVAGHQLIESLLDLFLREGGRRDKESPAHAGRNTRIATVRYIPRILPCNS